MTQTAHPSTTGTPAATHPNSAAISTRAVPPNSDLPSYHPSPNIDEEFDRIFGDHVHLNDGTHLHDHIEDDPLWQQHYNRLTSYHCTQYNVPSGSLGERFVETAATLLDGVMKRTHNSEKFLVFLMTTLQRVPHITRSRNVKTHLTQQLDAWDNQQCSMLVNETERHMKSFLTSRRSTTTPPQRRKIFNNLMLKGEVSKAVQHITTTEESALLNPSDDSDGYIVEHVLAAKHPDPTPVARKDLPGYDELPPLVPITVTDDTVLAIARRLKGSCGLDGTHSHSLRSWLTQYHQASDHLRQSLASLTETMSNQLVPWPAIRALMSCRLIAIDKDPGVRPIGIGHIWRRAMAKCFLSITAPAATEACSIDQLCAGLQVGIEGAIHAANQFWKEHAGDSDFGFLMIDAKNAFNEQHRITMLWTTRHEWPQGALFTFNCYKHWTILIAHDPSGAKYTFLSKVGATQGDPIAMIIYALGLLPLIRQLKLEFPTILFHSWYADDGAAAATIPELCEYFQRLSKLGPVYGYYPQAKKSILVVPSPVYDYAKKYFEEPNRPHFPLATGHRYLGGFIGEPGPTEEWLSNKTSTWETSVRQLATACKDYPQTAYCAMQKSLQMQWQFVQRVVCCPSDTFSNVELALAADFLPALFDSKPPPRAITSLPIKLSGLAIMDPTATCQSNYNASQSISGDIIHSLIIRNDYEPPPFSLKKHLDTVISNRIEHARRLFEQRQQSLQQFKSNPTPNTPNPAILDRAQQTGAWLSLVPTLATKTTLSPSEFRDGLLLRYGLPLKHLPTTCDGCNKPFDIEHALTCKKGGLVILRHNELRDEIASIAATAFNPSAVSLEPLINQWNTHNTTASHPTASNATASTPTASNTINLASQPTASLSNDTASPASGTNTPPKANHTRGDILIRSFFDRAKDCIVDVTITDLDNNTNKTKSAKAALKARETSKKSKYSRACNASRKDFVPFVASADGLLGREAKAFLQRLAAHLADKWQRPYAPVCGYIHTRVAISLVRASHLCIRGSRQPLSTIAYPIPPMLQMDHNSGFHLMQH